MWTLVAHQRDLFALTQQLTGTSTYYLDTEFDSRADGTTLCLLQLHAEGQTHLVDAQALGDISELAVALGRPGVTWVLHGAHQDIPLLTRALRLSAPPTLFDTQIAWGLTSPEPSTSFSYLTYRILGTRHSKQHQTDDWTRRPLSKSQLSYAAEDVNTLPAMHTFILRRIVELGRERAVHDACYDLLCGASEPSELLSVESFRNAWQLEPAGQIALRGLISWFNALSPVERTQTLDSKLFWSLANRMPTTPEGLRQVRGMPRLPGPQQERILSLIREAQEGPLTSVQLIEPPPYATFERLELDAWLEYVRTIACAKARVSKELVLAGRRLRQLKELVVKDGVQGLNDQSAERILGSWQYSLVGEALLWAAHQIAAPASL